MQLRWIESTGGRYFETKVFDNEYAVTSSNPWSPLEEWKIVKSVTELLKDGFKTKEEAMVAAHQIIEKELEKGYIGKGDVVNVRRNLIINGSAKLSYIPEDMWGCKKALALFTNENGDEYIDAVLVSATIPKGSLVREIDPENHYGYMENDANPVRKCRSDKAIIIDILPPINKRMKETGIPTRKNQRKKISVMSIFIVVRALRSYFAFHIDSNYVRGRSTSKNAYTTIMHKLIEGFIAMTCGFHCNTREFGRWLHQITKPQFPLSLDLAIAAKLLEPYKDVMERYQDDSLMLCKVLLARILRDMGIMDSVLEQSYKIGDKIQIDNFDLSNRCCGEGFHFFKTAAEAWYYNFN